MIILFNFFKLINSQKADFFPKHVRASSEEGPSKLELTSDHPLRKNRPNS